ncbi:MAG TPA: acyl-CoA dehydrogenase family protein [Acidimicrobiales bacterium]|nr:acyl-CoA dehydrogenase family protein [Acidimicrobiales bacterium]
MNTDLAPEAVEYGLTARRAIEAAGGDELAQAAERESDRRVGDKVLDDLGAWDLDPRGSADELEAAAALCRAAGWWALPHPVAERLARPRDLDADALVVVAAPGPAGAVDGVDLRWVAVDLDGRRSRATPRPADDPVRTSGFVAALDIAPVDDAGAGDLALGLVLPCWTLLGMLDRAMGLTSAYVQQRHQFGQPLSSFQGVQFQLTDAEVERVGLEELARYALWSLEAGRPDAIEDALALRLAAIEAADVVFRITHQLHGAIGFCDETTLSWLSRASQPLRRLPLGLSATRAALTARLGRQGLAGLFGP